MPECGAPTASGRPCRRAVAEGRCHQHRAAHVPAPPPEPIAPPPAPAPPPPPQPCGRLCILRGAWRPCERLRAPGRDVCDFHHHVDLRRQAREANLAEAREARDVDVVAWRVLAPVRNRVAEALAPPQPVVQARLNALAAARARVGLGAARAAREARVGEVGRFAQDTQNVHTREVTQMINAFKLADESDADGPELDEIEEAFVRGRFGTRRTRQILLDDVERSWNAHEYYGALPFTYRRLLRVVWRRVKAHKERAELEKRLWEEATEALHMCAMGHMGRLANVLQGFDEAAPPPPVPRGELLQNAMARIAQLPVAQRRAEADKVFAELAVADDERGPWLDALDLDEEPEVPLVVRLAGERLARLIGAA